MLLPSHFIPKTGSCSSACCFEKKINGLYGNTFPSTAKGCRMHLCVDVYSTKHLQNSFPKTAAFQEYIKWFLLAICVLSVILSTKRKQDKASAKKRAFGAKESKKTSCTNTTQFFSLIWNVWQQSSVPPGKGDILQLFLASLSQTRKDPYLTLPYVSLVHEVRSNPTENCCGSWVRENNKHLKKKS